MKTGLERIQDERQRQIESEGWKPEGDDLYTERQLMKAAHCYARNDPKDWPWAPEWWKPGGDIRNLEKAGALYLAEKDRLNRAGLDGSGIMQYKAEEMAELLDEALENSK